MSTCPTAASDSDVTVAPGGWRIPPGDEYELVKQSAIHTESQYFQTPVHWDQHAHALHELVWVRGGSARAYIDGCLFTILGDIGLWIPAGVRHSGILASGTKLSSAFFAPDNSALIFEKHAQVAMTPLLTSLLHHLSRRNLPSDARARAEAVVYDALEPAHLQLWASIPNDLRVAQIAQSVIEDPGDARNLTAWAAELGTSERTISRVFRAATGLSFSQWRHSVRINHAMTLLVAGWDVQEVSQALGYAQASTFIAAFRRLVGTTPGAFRESA